MQEQRALQLRIEENARYLQKMMDENQIVGRLLLPATPNDLKTDSEIQPPKPDSEPPQKEQAESSSAQRATDSSETEQLSGHKRPREEPKLEETISSNDSISETPVQ